MAGRRDRLGGCSGARVSVILSPMAFNPDEAGSALALVTSSWASMASTRGPNLSGGSSVKASSPHAVVGYEAFLGKHGSAKPQLLEALWRARTPAPPRAHSIALPYHTRRPWTTGLDILNQPGTGVADGVCARRGHEQQHRPSGPAQPPAHRRRFHFVWLGLQRVASIARYGANSPAHTACLTMLADSRRLQWRYSTSSRSFVG